MASHGQRKGYRKLLNQCRALHLLLVQALNLLQICKGADVSPKSLLCRGHSDCPRDQVCGYLPQDSTREDAKLGACRCPSGSVLWKWRCYPLAPTLYSACAVSAQCNYAENNNRHCNPVTRRCDCDFGFIDVRGECVSTSIDHIMSSTTEHLKSVQNITHRYIQTVTMNQHLNKTLEQHLNKALEQHLNKTLEQHLNVTRENHGHHGLTKTHHHQHKDQEFLNRSELDTIMYIALALTVVLLVWLMSYLYMKIASVARRKSHMRGVVDFDSVSVGSSRGGSYDGSRSTILPADLNQSTRQGYIISPPPIDPNEPAAVAATAAAAAASSGRRRPSKILLTPLEDKGVGFPTFPKPPALPPAQRRRRSAGDRGVDPRFAVPRPRPGSDNETDLSNPSVSAISRSLMELRRKATAPTAPDLVESAASFPDEHPTAAVDQSLFDDGRLALVAGSTAKEV